MIQKYGKGVYIASTKQHVGKTSTCLGLLMGLTSRFKNIGYLKPVGQQSVLVEDDMNESGIPIKDLRVDKDVRVAKEVFNLKNCKYSDMSPVVIPAGYTRDFLDGKISLESQLDKIHKSYHNISLKNDFTIVEGTGHTGVGSIVNVNNARVAAELGIDMLLIANGGIGSAFDELTLNYIMCKKYNVNIRGVILNKVKEDKVDMMWEYFPKALKSWNNHNFNLFNNNKNSKDINNNKNPIPLIGVVPDLPTLSCPSMFDYEELFDTTLLSGHNRRFTQYQSISLVTSGLRRFLSKLSSNNFNETLFVTHASRNDIILGFLSHSQNYETKTGKRYKGALILTGTPPLDQPQEYIMEIISRSKLPVLYSARTTYQTMERISNFTAKYNATDKERVLVCAKHYEKYINFDLLLRETT